MPFHLLPDSHACQCPERRFATAGRGEASPVARASSPWVRNVARASSPCDATQSRPLDFPAAAGQRSTSPCDAAPPRPLGFGILLFVIFLGFGILGFGICGAIASTPPPPTNTLLNALDSPIILKGTATTAYRDPLLIHHNGLFYLYYSYVLQEEDNLIYWYVALSTSTDLKTWTPPRILTPKDQNLNYSSPGNILRIGDEWVMSLQTYPIANFRRGDRLRFCDDRARVFTMRSKDLLTWSASELIRVKGPHVPESEMGKMIDPYILHIPNTPADVAQTAKSAEGRAVSPKPPSRHGTAAVPPPDATQSRPLEFGISEFGISNAASGGVWWCFYKQDGHMHASLSTDALKTWKPATANIAEGENACVLIDPATNEYVFFYAPANGVGVKRGPTLDTLREDHPPLTFDQPNWPWTETRLTAGYVEDLRHVPGVGKYVMVFHGMGPGKKKTDANTNAHCSIGIAWSNDLRTWHWPGRGEAAANPNDSLRSQIPNPQNPKSQKNPKSQ